MNRFRNILCALLAVLVLMSSTSFMVGIHICSGDIQNVALFAKAEGCEMEKELPPCHQDTTAPCCEDEALIHKGDEFKVSASSPEVIPPLPVDLIAPPVLISEIIPDSPLSRTGYHPYDPPLRSCDLNVEHRVFRI